MKRLLIATTALTALAASAAVAADIPAARMPAKAPVMAPLYNWTGFYIGGHIGGGWADIDATSNTGVAWGSTSSAFIGGAQMGYNWQISQFVLGIEGDFSWTDGSKTSGFATLGGVPLQLRGDWDWTATIAGRFGYAADRVLFYGKLGAGWSRTSARLQTAGGAVVATNDNTNVGLLVGGGIEYAFTQNWTGKLEYNYLALGDRTFAGPGGTIITADPDVHMFKAGVNYKF